MNLASRTNRHRRYPAPAKRFQIAIITLPVHADPAIRLSGLSFPHALRVGENIQRIIDFLIRLSGHNGDRAANTVAGEALVSGRGPGAIVEYEFYISPGF